MAVKLNHVALYQLTKYACHLAASVGAAKWNSLVCPKGMFGFNVEGAASSVWKSCSSESVSYF